MAGDREPVSTWAGPLDLSLAGPYATQSCSNLRAEVRRRLGRDPRAQQAMPVVGFFDPASPDTFA